MASVPGYSTNQNSTIALFKDNDSNAISAIQQWFDQVGTLQHKRSAGSTSSQTFKVRVGITNSSYDYYLNGYNGARVFGGVSSVLMTITEVEP